MTKRNFKDFDELSTILNTEYEKKPLTEYVDAFFLKRKKLSEIISLAVKEAKKRGKTFRRKK